MKYVEMRVLSNANVVAGYLPDYKDLVFDGTYGAELSVLEFSYPAYEGAALGIAPGLYITIYIDGTATQQAFVVEKQTADELTEDGVPMRRWLARSVKVLLNDDFVWPSAYPNPLPQGHDFIDSTAGTIMKTLLTRSRERGFLTHVVDSFTGINDSASTAWTSMMDRTYATGTSLLTVLTEMFDQGAVDCRMRNLTLDLYRPGTLPVHRPITTICFTAGLSLAESTVEQDATEFATDVLLEGDEGVTKTSTYPTGYTFLGRRRAKYVQSGGISDAGTLQSLSDAYLQQFNHIFEERTVAVPHDTVNPFIDYLPGDWVWFDILGQVVELQIKQISVSVSDDGNISVGVTVGDLMADSMQRLQRRIDAITGSNSGTYGPIPTVTPEGLINFAPHAPDAPNVVPSVYLDGAINRVAVTVTWTAVTSNEDDTPATDIAGYDVYCRPLPGSGYWQHLGHVEGTALFFSPLPTGVDRTFKVTATDEGGLTSADSPFTTITLPTDNTAPERPSATTNTVKLGTASISWDGKDYGGAAMPVDFAFANIYVSTQDGFTPSTASYVDRFFAAGKYVYTGATYDTPYYVKLIAYDTSGNPSTASTQSTFTVTPLVGADLSIGVAGNKSTVSATAPSNPTTGDLWIDTANGNVIKVWDGGLWVPYQDAAIATAQSAATAAQSTADGKNKVYYSTNTPGTTANVAGDIWFRYSAGVIIGQWVGAGGSSWNSVTLDNLVIANLDAGKITTGTLDAARIATNSLTVGQISGLSTTLAAKTTTFAQDDTPIPTSTAIGDIWVDTTAGHENKMYRAESVGADAITAGEWVLVSNVPTKTFVQNASPIPTALHIGDIWVNTADANQTYIAKSVGADAITTGEWELVASTVTGATKTWVQTAIPTSTSIGDIWVDTDDQNKTYVARIVGADQVTTGEWELLTSTATGVTKTWVQASIPTSLAIGDIWVDSDDANKTYVARMVGADQITAGEWEVVSSTSLGTKTFAQDATPTSTSEGDLWINTSSGANKIYRAYAAGVNTIGATGWVLYNDPTSKTTTFVQSSIPVSKAIGDIWVDTTAGQNNTMYIAQSIGADAKVAGEWVAYTDPRIGTASSDIATLQSNYTTLSGRVDGKAVVWYQTTAPGGLTAADTGDIWIDSDHADRLTQVWSGSAWTNITDQKTLDTLATVNTKITTFYAASGSTPTATAIGDLWVVTDLNNKLRRASATGTGNWVDVTPVSTRTFTQASIPVSTAAGDMWVDTDDSNKTYVAKIVGADAITTGEWELFSSVATTKTFAQDTTPSATAIGDLWVNTTNSLNRLYRATATGTGNWVEVTTRMTFTQDAVPVSLHIGDMWVDTNDGNKTYVAKIAGADAVTAGEWELVTGINNTTYVQATAPTALVGDIWFMSSDGNRQMRYGTTTRTNLCTNPSFETNTTGWTANNCTASVQAASPASGTNSVRLAPTSTSTDSSLQVTTGPLATNKTYTISATIYIPTTLSGSAEARARKINVAIQQTSGGPWTTYASTASSAYGGTTARLSVTFTTPATIYAQEIRLYNGYTNSASNYVYWDAVLIEEAPYVSSYFDGSLAGSAWTGTAHASTSTTLWSEVADPGVVSTWRYLGTTTIDGGKVAADTITAASIAASTITASEMAAGSIITDKIAANAVTADKVNVGAITAQKIQLGVIQQNLIRDPSFEDTYDLSNYDPFGSGPGGVWTVGNVYEWRWGYTQPVGASWARSRGVGRARSGATGLSIYTPSNEAADFYAPSTAVEIGQTYRFSFHAAALDADCTVVTQMATASTPEMTLFDGEVTLVGDMSTWSAVAAVDLPLRPESFTQFSWTFVATNTWVMPRIISWAATGNRTLVTDDFSIVKVGVGGASELTSAGLRLFDDDGYERTALVTGRSNMLTVQDRGVILAAVDEEGHGTFEKATTRQDLSVQGRNLLGLANGDLMAGRTSPYQQSVMESMPLGILQWGKLTSVGPNVTSTEKGYIEIAVPIYHNRLYKIATNSLRITSSATSTAAELNVYITTGAAGDPSNWPSTPLVASSTRLCRINPQNIDNVNGHPMILNHLWMPDAGGVTDHSFAYNARLLLSLRRYSGSGTLAIDSDANDFVEFWVEDLGPARVNGGQANPGDGSVTGVPLKTLTKTYTSNGWMSYREDNARRSEAQLVDTDSSTFETTVGRWTGAASATVARSTTRAYAGSASMLVTWPTSATFDGYATWSPPAPTIIPGETYCAQARVWVPAGHPPVKIAIVSEYFPHYGSPSTTTGAWEWISTTFTPSRSETMLTIRANAATTSGQQVWVDEVRLDQISNPRQGYTGTSGNGIQKGIWTFPSLTADLTGAQIWRIRAYLTNLDEYYTTANIYVGTHTVATPPLTAPTITASTTVTGWPEGVGKWVVLPDTSGLYAAIVAGTVKGLAIGPPPGGSNTYKAQFSPVAQIEIQYTK